MSEKKLSQSELEALSAASKTAGDRLAYLFDEGKYTELMKFVTSKDSLSGVITAFGFCGGVPVYAFSQDVSAKSGALTKEGAEKIQKLYDLAAETGAPVVGIFDSYGADVSDALTSLSAYGVLLLKSANVSGVVPTVSVVCGTCAGAAAMLAVNADAVIVTKESELYVTPNSGIKDLAENAAKTGIAAIIADDDKAAVEAAAKLLSKLPQNNLSPAPMYEYADPTAAFGEGAAAQAEAVFDEGSVFELYQEFGGAAFTAFATLFGASVGVAASNKTADKLTPADASKLAGFVRMCDSFNIPVVTFVDTEGFETDENGAVKAMAQLSHAYSEATTVKLAVVTGKAYGSAFISLAGKGADSDMTFALDSAVISALDPITAVEFLSHDKLAGAKDLAAERQALADEYVKSECTAYAAAQSGAVDAVVTAAQLRETLFAALGIMEGKRAQRLPKKHSNIKL